MSYPNIEFFFPIARGKKFVCHNLYTCKNIGRLSCKENHIVSAKLIDIAIRSKVNLHTK